MQNAAHSARARIRIRKPPADVFDAFADAGRMSRFWFTRRDDGLREGETSTWFLGSGDDAASFDVMVQTLRRPETIVIEWTGYDGHVTQVTWTIEDAGGGESILTIEESGFSGSPEAVVARALDSTGGFNQVIVAAKAVIEHGVGINVVDDHA